MTDEDNVEQKAKLKRVGWLHTGLRSGYITVNQARILVGLEPIEAENELLRNWALIEEDREEMNVIAEEFRLFKEQNELFDETWSE